jgi:two-component system response regulator ArlR
LRLLLIEDEIRLSEALACLLKKHNYAVDTAPDGITGQDMAETGLYDIVILDRMLPGKDGIDVLRELRAKGIHTPVIMLTAKDSVVNRVEGLDSGADDYLVKPFAVDELLARLRALGRRQAELVDNEELKLGGLAFNPYKGEARCRDGVAKLTLKESQILEMLLRNRNLVLTKEQILQKVWGFVSEVDLNNVEVHLSYIRRKLAALGCGVVIETVRGLGYCIKEG